MRQITTLLLFITLALTAKAADGIKFEKNQTWTEIKAKALKERKMIFFDAYTSWCGPCKYLESDIYTEQSVASYFNSNFINVKFDMEKGEGIQLAQEFRIMAYPTLLFFSPEGKLVHKTVGAMEAPEFITLGKDARDPEKQFYTQQQKVQDKQASKESFFKWLKMAEEIDDAGRGAAAASWLSAQKDLLASAELTSAAMLYAEVNEEQLATLYKEKKKIQSLLKWNTDKTAASLYQKLFNLAYRSHGNNTATTTAFSNLIKKFEPAKADYALRELQLFTALNLEGGPEKAMNLLLGWLRGNSKPSIKETSMLFFNYAGAFDEPFISKLKTSLAAYKLTAADKGRESWLYLMQFICYLRLEDFGKAQMLSEKVRKTGGLTEPYKGFITDLF